MDVLWTAQTRFAKAVTYVTSTSPYLLLLSAKTHIYETNRRCVYVFVFLKTTSKFLGRHGRNPVFGESSFIPSVTSGLY